MEELTDKLDHLQTINELQRGWIAMISHHFKGAFSNMLMLIEAYESGSISSSELVDLLPQLKEDAVQNLKLISEASVWLKTIGKDYVPDTVSISMTDLFTHLKSEFQSRLESKDLKFFCGKGEDFKVKTDRFLLTFILERLLDNAIKYSQPGQSVELRGENTEKGIRISVVDKGTGMSARQLDNVFSFDAPVYRGTQGELGLGLSLKIVQSFISLLGAKIEFDSSENEGTEVNIYLPLRKI